MELTTRNLARLMSEELEKESWGDIDPYLLEVIANEADKAEDEVGSNDAAEASELQRVLDRVIERLKSE